MLFFFCYWVYDIAFALDAFRLAAECTILILENWFNFSDGMFLKSILTNVKDIFLFLDWEISNLHIGNSKVFSSTDSNFCGLTPVHLILCRVVREIRLWVVLNFRRSNVVICSFPINCRIVFAIEKNVLARAFFNRSNLFLKLLECKFCLCRHPLILTNCWISIP
jgi:hypothetical protein